MYRKRDGFDWRFKLWRCIWWQALCNGLGQGRRAERVGYWYVRHGVDVICGSGCMVEVGEWS